MAFTFQTCQTSYVETKTTKRIKQLTEGIIKIKNNKKNTFKWVPVAQIKIKKINEKKTIKNCGKLLTAKRKKEKFAK